MQTILKFMLYLLMVKYCII